MAFTHGKNTYVGLDNNAGVITNITAYLNSASFERVRDTVESTVFGNNAKTYLPGLADATFSIEGKFDPALDQILADAYASSATKTVEYGPEGNATGKTKYSMETLITSYSTESPVDDLVTLSAEFQCTGVVTRGTF